ncbi:MAG: archaellin/type IV pilin N-terminal domain-containing protein [Desulfurococcaceae archaeon]
MAGKRGIVGIEAAIVLIAFVIVAAALAFVVLNMGMFTTQKSKEVMNQALNEASSALEVDGSVMAYVNDTGFVRAIYIPLKISPGQQAVDLSNDKVDVVIRLPGGTFSKINAGDPANASSPVNYTQLYDYVSGNGAGNEVNATFYFVQSLQTDTNAPSFKVLEIGEKVILVIYLPDGLELKPYDRFIVEIRPLAGAPLTVERLIPPTLPLNEFVSLI